MNIFSLFSGSLISAGCQQKIKKTAIGVKYPTGSIRLAKTGFFIVDSYFLYVGVA
jgi:hypothetical protein